MRIIFLTIARINSISEKGIYQDLLKKFNDEGHEIVIVTPVERKYNQKTCVEIEGNVSVLKVRTPNLLKTNIIEKGIGIILVENLFKNAIKKFFLNTKFDLILYATPPITFTNLILYLKKRDNAYAYLLLKDIFPQNAVDLKMISSHGIFHKYFRSKEKQLYKVSDSIGCMSEANKKYLIENNPEINENKIEVNPNSIYINNIEKASYIKSFTVNIPDNKVLFVYGGNLGKPQGIDFLLETISACRDLENIHFIIVGSGTETRKIKKWFELIKPHNATLINELGKDEYNTLLKACHVGLILLHPDFTIPNYPSRILSYMENSLPILSATDSVTDIGIESEKNGYGFSCRNGDIKSFKLLIEKLANNENLRKEMGEIGFNYMTDNFNVDLSYNIIMKHFEFLTN
ncbi:MAG TPA: glycosyltransferase family 4 protein [Sediminibacterium sp.]|uniref:glycosyltransferase family 4 protein n=1 Tax=Sediminibacterium sp. TaxID=1917865 RepID=UPI0008AB8856|nr:glycosyltransferase family 4 protein [Sediminibacterium sp.]OHC84534.1 MAG: hypothetical protein A2472_11265 [Sphingobacteriia bacterium RIFOXYC2_FULL_35_18]HLD53086.1 glycosyltransferase family 4 protein [Sediminibacterium sp.]